jgi:hypothetical protein
MDLGRIGGYLSLAGIGLSAIQKLLGDLEADSAPIIKDSIRHPDLDQAFRVSIIDGNNLNDRMEQILGLVNKYRSHEVIHRVATHLAQIAASRFGEKNETGKLLTIFLFVKHSICYIKDINALDTYQSPVRTLELRRGDCDDFTILIMCLALNMGMPALAKTIWIKGQDDWGHIYPLVGVPAGKKVRFTACDATVKSKSKPGYELPDGKLRDWRVYRMITEPPYWKIVEQKR